jgi:putative Mg2+ transporter-C (MgtC) family protein
MEYATFIARMATAIIAGALIGVERELHHKSAGIRTNALAALGAALFVLLSLMVTSPQGDSTRIIAQVVTGVGFLGSGIIFKEGPTVHGLTTAVTIWCSSAVGCFAGAGLVLEALSAAVLVLLVNVGLKPLEERLGRGKREP